MKFRPVILIVISGICLGSFTTSESPNQTYKHPALDIMFTAPSGWTENQWLSDPNVFEVVNPQSTVHVVLWHTETEQNALGYLIKMADMKGLDLEREAEKIAVGRIEAWLLDTTGLINSKPIHTYLVVIPNGKIESRPRENLLLIAQIWCPEESSAEDVATMKNILSTLRTEE